MRAVLLEVPQNEAQWDRWSTHHKQDHDLIAQAVRQQKGINLNQYQLDPIPFNAIQQWLAWNQAAHDEMDSAIGAQGSDLEDTDLTDKRQLEAWIWLHYQEHLTAGNALKV